MQYIKIDTAARTSPSTTSPAQCTIHSNNHIFHGRYGLKLVYVPITFFNITAANNLIYFTDTATHTASIPVGFYDSTSILAAVGTAMTTASGTVTYTVTKNSSTYNVIISASSGTFVLNNSNQVNSIASSLGFTPYDTVAALFQTSSTVANLSQVRSLNVSINGLSGIEDTSSRGAYSFIVPITVNQQSIQVYEPISFIQTINFDSPTRDLSITIYDDKHNVIPLQDDYFFILQRY